MKEVDIKTELIKFVVLGNMEFITKKFQELNTIELYQILQLRAEVFVVEQDCIFQDLDNKDQIALNLIKQNTSISSTPLKESDFDSGEARTSSIQILKDVKNVLLSSEIKKLSQ